MVKVSKKNKIPSKNETFNKKLIKKIKNKYGYFDFILANHVLNHADDDFNFLLGCVNLLKKNSILIIEVPYWAYQVKNSLFDQIYHEHRSYFTVSYFNFLQKKLNLKIVDIKITDYHGKSIKIYFTKNSSQYKSTEKLSKFLLYEKDLKLNNLSTYKSFQKNIKKFKKQFLDKIRKIPKILLLLQVELQQTVTHS